MVFSKMLAKGMSLIEFENCNFFNFPTSLIEFENCNFFNFPSSLIEFENCSFFNFWRGNSSSEASERELPPSDTRFLNFQRFIKVLTKASKQEKWEDLQTW